MSVQDTLAPGTDRPAAARRSPIILVGLACLLVGAMIPIWMADAPFLLMLASHAAIAALVALSLDMLTGNTGLLSFGHAAWYGLGAYATGLLAKHLSPEMMIVLPLAALAVMTLAAIVGAIFVLQVGKTFAIITLAFSQVLYAAVFVFSDWTGGEDGLQGIPVPTAFGRQITSYDVWYWILYGVLVGALLLALHLRRSPLGRSWLAIRANTERARFVGVDVARYKLVAYVISAGLAALAGGLYVLFNGATSPETLHWFESGKILMYVVLGGVGTIIGPVIGAAVFTVTEHYVSSVSDAWLIYFGGLFVVIVIVAPGGIFGALGSLWARVTGGHR